MSEEQIRKQTTGLVIRRAREEIKHEDQEKQTVSTQQTRETAEEIACDEGIVIPLNLPEFRRVDQHWHEDGSLNLTIMARSLPRMVPSLPGPLPAVP